MEAPKKKRVKKAQDKNLYVKPDAELLERRLGVPSGPEQRRLARF
jgi:hypothetical protein